MTLVWNTLGVTALAFQHVTLWMSLIAQTLVLIGYQPLMAPMAWLVQRPWGERLLQLCDRWIITSLLMTIIAVGAGSLGTIPDLGVFAVGTLIFGGILWFFYIKITNFFMHAFKRRYSNGTGFENPLTAKSTYKAVAERLNDEDGVFAGNLPKSKRDLHWLHIKTDDRAVVIGPPGTGKTAFLVSQLLMWAKTGRPFVVLDIKPEIYGIVRKELEGNYSRLITYNPTAGTGDRYNPLDDAKSVEDLGELAAALVPSRGEETAVFHENARNLLDAIVCHLREAQGYASLPMVRDYLVEMDSPMELLSELKKSPSSDARDIAREVLMLSKSEKLVASIFGDLRTNLRFLRSEKIRESLAASDFSLADLNRSGVGLFLQFEEQHHGTTAHLFSAFVAHMMRYFIAHTDRPPILLLLDEIGNAPAIPGFVSKLNTIRSRKLPTWMYWQSKEQMQPYGQKSDEGPNKILAACDMQMVFRLNDNATAEWMSQKIGTVDRVYQMAGESSNESGGRSDSSSETLRSEAVVKPHELQQLESGQVVSEYAGMSWVGMATPYWHLIPNYKGFKPSLEDIRGRPYLDAETRAALDKQLERFNQPPPYQQLLRVQGVTHWISEMAQFQQELNGLQLPWQGGEASLRTELESRGVVPGVIEVAPAINHLLQIQQRGADGPLEDEQVRSIVASLNGEPEDEEVILEAYRNGVDSQPGYLSPSEQKKADELRAALADTPREWQRIMVLAKRRFDRNHSGVPEDAVDAKAS